MKKGIRANVRRSSGSVVARLLLAALITLALSSALQGWSNASETAKKTGKAGKRKPIKRLDLPAMTYRNSLPTNFPVALYTRNITKRHFMHSTRGSSSAAVTLETTDEPRQVFAWYRSISKKRGWRLQTPGKEGLRQFDGQKQGTYFLRMTRKRQQAYVFCLPAAAGNGTTINISWSYMPGR